MEKSNEKCGICGSVVGQHRFSFERSLEKVDDVISPEEFREFLLEQEIEKDEEEYRIRLEEGKPEAIITPERVEPIDVFCNEKCWEKKLREIVESKMFKRLFPDCDQSMVQCAICDRLILRFDSYIGFVCCEEVEDGTVEVDGEEMPSGSKSWIETTSPLPARAAATKSCF